MEATGLYWEGLARFLHKKGATVFVVNARRIKGFAMSEDKRTKTDKVDAGVIARFCRAHLAELKPWSPPAPEVHKLLSLTRQLESLKEDRSRQKVRLKSATMCTEVAASINHHIQSLSENIKKVESAIASLLKQNEDLGNQHKIAKSVTGVGKVTASIVLAETRLFENFSDRRQVAAFAGLDVSEFRSGSSIRSKPRLSKRGSARIRKALYMAALSAKKHNPVVKKLYERLVVNGKTKMQAIGACMRKLLELIFAVVKSGQKFDPEYESKRSGIKLLVAA
jgi:transposase